MVAGGDEFDMKGPLCGRDRGIQDLRYPELHTALGTMSRLSVSKEPGTTAYALLALLRLRAWGTYELAKQVKRSLRWFWPRAERSLYKEPKLLVARGLATATTECVGKRPRTVYAITDAGRAELAAWLSEPAEPRTTDFAAMLKVFFADAGNLEQLTDTLTGMEAEARNNITVLTTMARESLASFPFPNRLHLSASALRMCLDQEITIVRWVEWMREQSTHWTSTTDSGNWSAEESLRELIALGERWQGTTPRPQEMITN